ncbi:hypothetical protein IE53DRAFT_238042 [Violaceomyces palustris]|uniref:Uncharacterized protein n=1 Tax=Violaceomyces palustris TaxID=1673888 RepID=A0ACD0NP73_9BASI|nr:hypothetical protein IE53DRAFT_238042 [Violaceomyces palustris]
MPPPTPSNQSTISSFFKPKSTSTATAQISSQHHRLQTESKRTGPPSSATTHPSKRAKLQPQQDENTRSQSIKSKLSEWNFVDCSDPSTQARHHVTPSQEIREKRSRVHEAFKEKLLSQSFPNPRQEDSLGCSDEDDLSADPTDGKLAREAEEDEAEQGGEPPTANPFQKFSSKPSNKQQLVPSKSKSVAKLNASEQASQKYTPLEKQILELKSMHKGVLLIIEVGYKFKFYDEDARIASKELNIMCFKERNLMTAMIPIHRLSVHVKKLISLGHKVGIVRQIETRALKAASGNAGNPFERKLTELYTSSTWVDEVSSFGNSVAAHDPNDLGSSRSLVSVVERLEGVEGGEEKVSFGLVSIQVSTGSIIFDQFSDGYVRSELETRMAHLQPAEILLPPNLSRATEKLIKHLSDRVIGTSGEMIRVERAEKVFDYNEAFGLVTKFYEEDGRGDGDEGLGEDLTEFDTPQGGSAMAKEKRGEVLSVVVSLPHLVLSSLAATIQHLRSFQLCSIFDQTTHFQSFSSSTSMLLDSNTLTNLEIFRNSTDPSSGKGSLLWVLDRTKTAMGKRLLRRWIARPLNDIRALRTRADAVQEMVEARSSILRSIPSLLQGVPDLEKGMARLTYGRTTPSELVTILLCLNRITQEYKPVSEDWEVGLESSLLNEIIRSIPEGKSTVQRLLNQVSIKEARSNDKANLFVDQDRYPKVQQAKDNIAIVEEELKQHLKELRKVLKRPSLEFVSVSGVEYLVEVRVADSKKVPADWLRVSATKTMVRFHTPTAMRLIKARERFKETLQAEAHLAYKGFLSEICKEDYLVLRNVVSGLAQLDALVSLANVGNLPGWTRAEILGGGSDRLELRGFRNPIIESLREETYVPNDIELGRKPGSSEGMGEGEEGGEGGDEVEENKAILLTGSNMGGKSSLARSVALCLILAQVGSHVPAQKAVISIHDSILTRMGAQDEIGKNRSTFRVELEETRDILERATSRSFVILDELGRGTSSIDGLAIAFSVLKHLLQRERSRRPKMIFVTHYFQLLSLAKDESLRGRIRNMYMDFVETESEQVGSGSGDKEITFLYRLREGDSMRSFGIHCARLAGLPLALLENASLKSQEMETVGKQRERRKRLAKLENVVTTLFRPDLGSEQDLVHPLEMLKSLQETGLHQV